MIKLYDDIKRLDDPPVQPSLAELWTKARQVIEACGDGAFLIRGGADKLAKLAEEGENTGAYFDFAVPGESRESATLYVELNDFVFSSFVDSAAMDPEGNVWRKAKVRFEVNHPCWGSCSGKDVAARAECILAVAKVAMELERVLGSERWTLWKSREEVAADEAEAARREIDRKLAAIIEANRKGMRVGQLRYFSGNHGLEQTKFNHEHVVGVDGKEYSVGVGHAGGTLYRTK